MTYKYDPVHTLFFAISLPICLLMAVGSWFFDRDASGHVWFALITTVIFGGGALIASYHLFMCKNWVRLDKHSLEIKLLGRKDTINYNAITAVKKNGLFITVYAGNGRYRIDKGIGNNHLIYEFLQQRLEYSKLIEDKNPYPVLTLPYTAQSQKWNVIIPLSLGLFALLGGIGLLISSTLSFENWPKFMLMSLGSLTLLGFAFFLLRDGLWRTPKAIHFDHDHITVQHIIGQQTFSTDAIQNAHINLNRIGNSKQFDYVLTIYFNKPATPTLEIENWAIKDHVFNILDLMTRCYPFQTQYHKVAKNIPYRQFAQGSNVPFSRYFEGNSQVSVNSVTEICNWLKDCRYIKDREQFNAADKWVHPLDFEVSRQGDCEDHALWAWRKLEELGYETEFVIGYVSDRFRVEGHHAWVTYKANKDSALQNGRFHLIETTGKTHPIVFPIEEKEASYRPIFSVDKNFQTYRY